jgi:hypothetical protein
MVASILQAFVHNPWMLSIGQWRPLTRLENLRSIVDPITFDNGLPKLALAGASVTRRLSRHIDVMRWRGYIHTHTHVDL